MDGTRITGTHVAPPLIICAIGIPPVARVQKGVKGLEGDWQRWQLDTDVIR